MRDFLSPVRASLAQATRRRSVVLLLVAALGVFGLIAWGTFSPFRARQRLVEQAERGTLPDENLFALVGGYGCDEDSCRLVSDTGEPIGPDIPLPVQTPGAPGPDSPTFIPPDLQAIEGALPGLLPFFRQDLERRERALSPRATFRERERMLGTMWGVLFAVLAGATIAGAEWRWGVWRTLLSHEPRRGRVLAVKLATVWVIVAAGFAIALAFTAGLDAIFRALADVGAGGGPRLATLARTAGRALLPLEFYATLAAAFATVVRTSFAGVGSLGLLLADGLVTRRFTWLRDALPVQQVTALLPPGRAQLNGYAWWPPLPGGISCTFEPDGAQLCVEKPLPAIPPPRAILVLLAWTAIAGLLAWLVLRARDVPQ